MKKLFIGLLVVAAGAGTFFFLRKKNNSSNNDIKKEWIVGKWKADSLRLAKDDTISDFERTGIVLDSDYKQYSYNFFPDNIILKKPFSDSLKADTLYYYWGKGNELKWSRSLNDTAHQFLQVIKLNSGNMILQSNDSTMIWFQKAR